MTKSEAWQRYKEACRYNRRELKKLRALIGLNLSSRKRAQAIARLEYQASNRERRAWHAFAELAWPKVSAPTDIAEQLAA